MPATLPRPALAAVHPAAHRSSWALGLAVLALIAVAALIYPFAAQAPSSSVIAREQVASPAQQQCLEAATLFHDVRWAAACSELAEQGQSSGYADCDLPNARAGRMYGLLRQAEQECQAEATRALAH
jgi:hypothetical protein